MDVSVKLDQPLGGGRGGGGSGRAPRQRNTTAEDKPYTVDETDVTNRLYVGSLDWGTSWQALKDHFKQCGNVVYADIFKDERGRSKGCGIIEFETRAEALNALRTLNRTTIGDSEFQIFCREDREDKHRMGPRGGGAKREGRRGGAGAEQLGAAVAAGGARSGVVITTRKYREQMGLDGGAGAGNVGGGGGGSNVGVQGRQVYVGNLPFSTTWKELKEAFSKSGTVVRAEIMNTPDGKSRGAGTVLFETVTDANRAVSELHEATFDGRIITVRIDRKAV